MQQNEIYNIPLPRGPWSQNKNKKSQRTWNKLLPVWIKRTQDSSRGHKISTRNGSVIGSDLTYKFEKLGSLFARCVCFEKLNKSDLPPSTTRARSRFFPAIFPLAEFPTPQDYQPHPLVPSLAASTMARSRGGTGNKI
jgi:hypothetical protein